MDKKKMIGTIIGVILFIALIAGATFALLTGVFTQANGNYNATSGNFIVTYQGGTEINNSNPPPQLASPTPATARVTVVKAQNAGNVPGTLKIKLNTTAIGANLASTQTVNYAICAGAACTTLTNGSKTVTSTGDVELLSVAIPATQTSYYVYFWLNANTITNACMGEEYSGYIHATAEQNH